MAKRILVMGAGSALGLEIADRLAACGHAVTATYRTTREEAIARIVQAGAHPDRVNLQNTPRLQGFVERCDAAVFTPILTESRAAAQFLRPDQPAVFLSSNNVAVDPGNPTYQQLDRAEREIRAAAPQACILRPTMIYGHPADRNLSRLMQRMRHSGVVLRPMTAARQQPVYFRDLGAIAAEALFDPALAGRTVAVGGPEIVSYRQLYRAIARAAGTRCLALPAPVPLARRLLPLARRLGLEPPVSDAQLARARADKHARGSDTRLGATTLAAGLGDLARELCPSGRDG